MKRLRVAVLTSPESWYFRDLCRAASASGDELTPLPFSTLAARLGADRTEVSAGGRSLAEFDAVLVRTMPPGSLEQVVFRMDALGELQREGLPVVNSPRSLEAAIDKYLCCALLRRAGLDIPDTIVCQTVDEALEAYELLGGDVVIKPVFGSEGRGLIRANDPDLAWRVCKTLGQLQAALYVQRFVPHEGHDLRLLVLGERVLAIRRHGGGDWRTNLSRGGQATPFEPSGELVELARRAAGAVGAELAGIDVLPGLDGRQYILEVNAVPGWKGLAAARGVDVAALVLEHLRQRVRES